MSKNRRVAWHGRARHKRVASALCATLVGAVLILTGATDISGSGAAQAAFPGLNGKIAFTRHWGEGASDVFVMNADGTGQTNLTNTPGSLGGYDPAWSPDGSRIAFDRDGEIFVMNQDGSGVANVTNDPAPDRVPAWSPDGTKIAFSRAGADGWKIFAMNADGSAQTKLDTSRFAVELGADWSPDGSRIAFTSYDAEGSAIFVMNPDGSGLTQLTDPPPYVYDGGATWSPDGRRIAFSSADAIDEKSHIEAMNADGTGRVALTSDPGWFDAGPSWSPDGRFITFSRWDANRPEADEFLMVMNADGSGQFHLTTAPYPTADVGPDWQPVPPPQCVVPNVVGQRLGTARAKIRHAKCSVGRVRYTRSRRARGRVIRQSPRPRTRLAQDGRVDLIVGKARQARR